MRLDLCRLARHLLLLFTVLAVATTSVDDAVSASSRNGGSLLPARTPRATTQPTLTTLIKRVLLPRVAEKRDLPCRKIHKPKYTDKCAFVRDNCEDEEVGFFDYLALYYCNFGPASSALKAIPMTIMILWMTILFTTIGIAASDFFCVNLSTISTILGMSQSLAGVTFLAFGNGSPDVFSTFAAMKINSGSLAVGELVGAASFITAVVAGSMAIVRPFTVAKKSFVRDVLFFMASVSLGIYFLYDGRILLWECVAMVGLYVSYVIFVVGWHWYTKRQKRKKIIEIRTRGHYTDIAEEEELEDEEDASMGVQRAPQLTLNTDFSALERNDQDASEDVESEEDRLEREEFAELNSNMRLGRPSIARHVTPVTPIRPSLIGALEFRSVMQSLNQDKNLHGRPIHLRSYSDDQSESNAIEPVIPRARHSRHHSTIDANELEHRNRLQPGASHLAPPVATGRARAVSVNDAANISNNTDFFTRQTQLNVPGEASPSSPAVETTEDPPLIALDHGTPLPTPTFNNYQLETPSSQHLAPPSTGLLPPIPSESVSPSASPLLSSRTSSRDNSPSRYVESPRPISRTSTNGDIPIINLPPSTGSTEASEFITLPVRHPKVFKYWPYAVLPAPDVFFSTLFPTLYTFNEKNLWGKFLAIFSAPPIFLLTITLPIVDVPEEPRSRPQSRKPSTGSVLPSPASTAPTEVNFEGTPVWMKENDEPKDWNRWLVATQCVTAPLFIVLAVCAGQIPLLFPILYALLSGLVALLSLMVFTRPDRPPKYRYLLCFVGFVVSICWISSIANEVVGVLKALGVILGISDAILGLTIFAVGNSLGDLVADITVARLGFPVMALSACFGGPMLNILLGIGVSGIYMTIRPSSENYYQIEVSSTLMISAVTLLATLVFLLVAVPVNNWKMTRGLGWALVAIWAVSTVVNVVVEVTGVGKRIEV